MELIQELLITASVAVFLSFLVAKVVSMAMAGDAGNQLRRKSSVDNEEGLIMEEMIFGERLSVQESESESRFHIVGDAVKKVGGPEEEKSVRVDEVFVDERGILPENMLPEGVEGASEVVELPTNLSEGKSGGEEVVGEVVEEMFESKESLKENSPEVKSDKEEVVEEKVGECYLVGVEEGNSDCSVVEEMIKIKEADEIDDFVEQSEEVKMVRCEVKKGDQEDEEGLFGDEDDWEGIEGGELEKDFAAAVNYVGKDDLLSSVGSAVQMQLYGLHKVATEGSCREPQPMASDVSARGKWNAWERLGNMNPEVAMEQYITLLSDRVPGWMEDMTPGEDKMDTLEVSIHSTPDLGSSTSLHCQPNITNGRTPELKSGTNRVDPTGGSNSVNRDKE